MASDPLQLTIPKGIVSWTPTGGTKRDLGEVSKFSAQLNVERKDFFSSRTGVNTKVRSVVTTKSISIEFEMNEWTPENLGMALSGELTGDTIDIFSLTEVTGALEIVGTNDVGAQVTATYYNVSLAPSNTVDYIADDWAPLAMSGEALVVASGENVGKFGSAVVAAGV